MLYLFDDSGALLYPVMDRQTAFGVRCAVRVVSFGTSIVGYLRRFKIWEDAPQFGDTQLKGQITHDSTFGNFLMVTGSELAIHLMGSPLNLIGKQNLTASANCSIGIRGVTDRPS